MSKMILLRVVVLVMLFFISIDILGISWTIFVVVLLIIGYYTDKKKKEKSIIINEPTVETEFVNDDSSYPYGTPVELIQAYESARYDQLRAILQKIAYGMMGDDISEKDKIEFKKIMTYFASRDPLYAKVINKFTVIIAKQEGIIQSKIYTHLPEYDTETLRYVLYFAHELGNICRVKKGRSYELYTSIDIYNKISKHSKIKSIS